MVQFVNYFISLGTLLQYHPVAWEFDTFQMTHVFVALIIRTPYDEMKKLGPNLHINLAFSLILTQLPRTSPRTFVPISIVADSF